MDDYIKIDCKFREGDKAFFSIGTKFGIEIIEDNVSSSIILDKEDIEKILPLMLAYYYKLNIYERMD
jgi:hypothetical protein